MPTDSHITIKDFPEHERPRERLLQHGAQNLSNTELLAIILQSGTASENVLHLAERIITQFPTLSELSQASATELAQIHGIGNAKSSQILALMELCKRFMIERPPKKPVIHNAQEAAQLVMDMSTLRQEQVRVILLDNINQVLAIHTIYIGTLTASVLRISEIYREAIIRNCPAIILVHNHPSGDASPSAQDIELTQVLISAGELLDIVLLDHIIIGEKNVEINP